MTPEARAAHAALLAQLTAAQGLAPTQADRWREQTSALLAGVIALGPFVALAVRLALWMGHP